MKLPLPNKNQTVAFKNFGLTQLEFEIMLEDMKMGNETLFEKIFLSQFEETITYLMHRYKVHYAQAYDVTMDTLLQFRIRLLGGKITYGNMRFLFTQMASQVLLDTFKTKETSLENINHILTENKMESNELLLDYLNKVWDMLSEKCQQLLKNYYYNKIPLNKIAIMSRESDQTLRKRKQRCLETLRTSFMKYYNA
ncbi:MAG: hypothetical protein GKR88_07225 [Flavobacteriaceae bacterium]|nr:MAG: hypothetical protein GKR88_07225 [Flavobacteriaceae bacterium]